MTARPGVVKEIVDIPISKQRRFTEDIQSTQEFVQLRHKLWELLKEEVIKSQQINKCTVEDCKVEEDNEFGEVDI